MSCVCVCVVCVALSVSVVLFVCTSCLLVLCGMWSRNFSLKVGPQGGGGGSYAYVLNVCLHSIVHCAVLLCGVVCCTAVHSRLAARKGQCFVYVWCDLMPCCGMSGCVPGLPVVCPALAPGEDPAVVRPRSADSASSDGNVDTEETGPHHQAVTFSTP